jgi:hypothetical protein
MATQQTIRRRLAERGRVRDKARETEAQSIEAIAELLRQGKDEDLTIKEMSELAGITRQTAYTLLGQHAKAGER